jgi:hypothetical protein
MLLVAIAIYIKLRLGLMWPWLWHWWGDYGLLIFSMLQIICALLSAGAAYTFGVSEKRPRIRVAAMVLGVFAGVWGAVWIPPFPLQETIGGILASLMAIGGGVLALKRPRVAGILMLLGAIVGKITMFDLYIFNNLFLLPGGALALAPEKKQPAAPDEKRPAAIYAAMVLGIMGGLFAVYCAFVGLVARDPWMLGIFPKEIDMVVLWIWIFLFPGLGLLGGILVLARPKVAGRLMLISGLIGPPVGIFVLLAAIELFLFVFYALASLFLITAGILASAAARRREHNLMGKV